MPPRPQTCTEGDEGHRVGLGATHSGHQDVVSQQRFDQQTEPQEEVVKIEAIRDARHLEIRLPAPFNDDESISRFSFSYSGISKSSTIPQRRRTIVLRPGIVFLFSSPFFSFPFLSQTDPVTFERALLSSRTSFVHRRSEKRPEGSTANPYSPRIVSGRVNEMMPADGVGFLTLQFAAANRWIVVVAIRVVTHPAIVSRTCRVGRSIL